jgi:hypothetical protein
MKLSALFLGEFCAAIFAVVLPAAASESLMGNRPWGFSQQTSRASIAALMMQHDGQSGSGGAATGGGNACGGGGTATATANYTCIILNNSDADIHTGQTSDGDQDANAVTSVTSHSNDEDSLSDILESLQ